MMPVTKQIAQRKSLLMFCCSVGALIALDQLTKAIARTSLLPLAQPLPLIPHVLGLSYVENRGAAFGMLQNQQLIFILIASVVSVGALYYVAKSYYGHPLELAALALIVGGALGNLIDRIAFGFVTDFFMTLFISFPVFNVADIAISCGCALFVIAQILQVSKARLHVQHSTNDQKGA